MTDLRTELQASLGNAYTLERELGGGGMSRVFVARDETLRREVVVKVLHPELLAGVSVERFRREILVAAALQNPHIVPVLAAGDTGGVPWFTMPFVQGQSLRERLADGPMPIAEVVGILRDVAKALSYAHDRGIVHRDIKPDNVLLSGGTAVVTDFGIAKALAAAKGGAERPEHESAKDLSTAGLTAIGTSIGTPTYMAPEQAAGDPSTDARADLYSLGCLAYELLAGRPPFVGMTPHKLLVAHLGERPVNVAELRRDTPPLLAELVMRCLEKDPASRPESAADVVRLLDAAASTSGSADALAAILLGGRVRLRAALALWLFATGAAWILAKAAIVGIGLPSWVLPGTLIVAGLGLPAILFTAFVQRTAHRALTRTPTLTPGGSAVAASTLATMAVRVSPHVSWRRTTRGGVLAFGAFILAVAAFMGMRALGIGPAASLLAAGVIRDRDPLLLADFSATGADTLLGRAVTEAIRTDLGESNVIQLVPASVVRQTLALMEKPPATPVDTGIARDIAVRSGVKAVLGGDIAPLGASYVLTARLISPSSGDVLAAFRETANDQRDLLPAVERLSRALRAKVGESLRRIQREAPLTQVTTSSLEALRLYAQGLHIGDDIGDVRRGRALLLEAVQHDSTFAMAWRKLGTWANNAGDPIAETYVKYAVDNASHLPPGERYTATAAYHMTAGTAYDPGEALADLRRAIDVDSTNTTAIANSAIQLFEGGRLDSAYALAARAARMGNSYAKYHLAMIAMTMGRAEADSLLADAHRVSPGFPYRGVFDVGFLYSRDELDSAEAAARRSGLSAAKSMLAGIQLARGQLAGARATLRAMVDSAAAAGNGAGAMQAIATSSWIESTILGQPAAAVAALRDAEQRFPLDRQPLSRRPYFTLAAAYAVAGRADRANDFIRQAERAYSPGLRRWYREAEMVARGLTALAESRPKDAVAALNQPVFCGASSVRTLSSWIPCPTPFLAAAYDRAGNADSARVVLERYVNAPQVTHPMTDGLVLAQNLQRLGELYEAKGDRRAAAKYYGRLLSLWKNADPAVKPRVDDVRRRMALLSDSERK